MQTKELRGILTAAAFVFGIIIGITTLTRALPAEWFPTRPPFNVLVVLVPAAVITFFAARFIRISTRAFAVISFVVGSIAIAYVFESRPHSPFTVPLFAALWTVAFLVGFRGHGYRQHSTQSGREPT